MTTFLFGLTAAAALSQAAVVILVLWKISVRIINAKTGGNPPAYSN